MRKGYTLLEILFVIISFPVAVLFLDGLFTTLLRDIPKSSRVVKENTTLLNALGRIQQDVEKAKTLPKEFDKHTAGDNFLLVDLVDETICYELKDGKILRHHLGKSQAPTVWSVPNADIKWRVWRKEDTGYAVEVKTHIRCGLPKESKKKMANSHLYFAGAL